MREANNHPNRNWRRAMRSAADAHLARYRWPDGGVQVMTPDQLHQLVRDAFDAGYAAGRLSVQRGQVKP